MRPGACGRLGWAAVWASIAAPLAASAEPPRVAPPPSWVEKLGVDFEAPVPAEGVSGGIHYLLLDEQIRAGRGDEEVFRRLVRRVLNTAGLESASQFSASYDPSYERLTLHAVRIHRGGRSLDRLDRAELRLLQRERRLEAQLYDGRVQAVLFVADLRVDDVLETAYSIRGQNPIFEGRFYRELSQEWGAPVHRLHQRVAWSGERPLAIRTHGSALAPRVRRQGAVREYRWEARELPAVEGESQVPPFWDSWAWTQVSEWSSWAEVVEWGRRVFDADDRLPPELEERLEAWRSLPVDEALEQARRFVQDDVRYLGIEMGASSHRPGSPGLVAERRYGDCKDKALLFCRLARGLGHRAWPALVATALRSSIDDYLPTPLAFNHAVAGLELDGRTAWIDLTISNQGGRGARVSFPAYERLLPLRPGVEGLVAVPASVPLAPTHRVVEHFAARDPSGPAAFTVTTRFSGSEADDMRRELEESNLEAIGRSYVEYYAKTWPQVRSTAPLQVRDDRAENTLVVEEAYEIPGFWVEDGEGSDRRVARVDASTLWPYMTSVPPTRRELPVALTHPVSVRHVTEIELPAGVAFTPDSFDLTTPELRFAYRGSRSASHEVRLEYDLATRSDTVPAGRLWDHLDEVDRMAERLRVSFRYPPQPSRSGPNWPVLATAALVLLVALLAAIPVFRWRRASSAPPCGRPLLALPAAVASSLGLSGVLVARLLRTAGAYSPGEWDERTVAGADLYHAASAPLLLGTLAVTLVLLVGCLLLLAVLLARRATFPGLLLAVGAGVVALTLADGCLVSVLPAASTAARAHREILPELYAALGLLLVATPPLLASRRLRGFLSS